jgi:hypothetical protein
MLHPEDGPFFHQLENEKAHFNYRVRKKKSLWEKWFGK